MANYSDLMAQAKSLMVQAEQARKAELASVINDIKEKMKTYGITVADLGGVVGKKPGKVAKVKSVSEPKFRGPQGELWAGGPGRKPEWVRAILAAGQDIEKYRI
ncbi:Hns DNA-binding protein H-NS [Burkholderiaceae bacterium]